MRIHQQFYWKLTVYLLSVTLSLTVISCGKKEQSPNEPKSAEVQQFQGGAFSGEIEEVILKKINIVTEHLARNSLIVNAVKEANNNNKDIPSSTVKKLDAKWMKSTDMDPYTKSLMTNECAKLLLILKESGYGFSEIFVTDARGLNVAMTNKTSDYYQADEDWWIQAFDNGRGRSYYGNIEYDESAMSEAVPIYVPVWNPDDGKAIGVVKAVVDIGAVKREL